MNDVSLNLASESVVLLHSADEIAERISLMAETISKTVTDNVILVAVLKGALIFSADLARALSQRHVNLTLDFITLGSYGDGVQSSGQVTLIQDISMDISGRAVLLVDDILETGRSLAFAKNHLYAKGAASVKTAVMLDKRVPRACVIEADYRGFTCEDHFIVGYGMDKAGRFRELPFIGILSV